ncbi:DUF1579 family protein [Dyella japonica]|uniref:DUF1579 family protein n=1 Tax=Dyella japonica TaxID=231455 RepID=UPI000374B252|nr:DUF1579 family protein [Dyella japonica]
MTSARALVLGLALIVSPAGGCAAVAAQPPATAPTPAPDPDPEHARLAAITGRWTVTQSLWEKPGQAPRVDHGTAHFSMVLDGRHLRQELHIDGPGKPFDGLGYIGYDNATGQYFSTWMDINFPGMVLAQGSFDPVSAVYTFKGSMADAGKPGARIPLREVLHVIDDKHFTYEYYEDHGAGEALTVRLEYAREG